MGGNSARYRCGWQDYQALTGDQLVNDAALWLQQDVTPEQVIASMKRLPFGDALEFSEPGEIRALSLNIFRPQLCGDLSPGRGRDRS